LWGCTEHDGFQRQQLLLGRQSYLLLVVFSVLFLLFERVGLGPPAEDGLLGQRPGLGTEAVDRFDQDFGRCKIAERGEILSLAGVAGIFSRVDRCW